MKIVEYFRVSTQRQSDSHLGIESQIHSVRSYVSSIKGEIVGSFTEVESGGNKDRIRFGSDLSLDALLSKRPTLQKAIQLAQDTNSTLCVKSACRISRFSLLIDYLLSCKINFICTDSPNDSPMIIKLKTSINEEEVEKISLRTKQALAALKRRGYKHIPKENYFTQEVLLKAAKRKKEIANNNPNNKRAKGYIIQLRDNPPLTGKKLTFQSISDKLNSEGFKSSQGKKFNPTTVRRLYLQE